MAVVLAVFVAWFWVQSALATPDKRSGLVVLVCSQLRRDGQASLLRAVRVSLSSACEILLPEVLDCAL